MNDMNLNVKGAVAVAMDYVRSLGELLPADQLRLEETVLQEDGHWLITLSYKERGTLDARSYKTFEVDPKQREVLAMRIRFAAGFEDGTF